MVNVPTHPQPQSIIQRVTKGTGSFSSFLWFCHLELSAATNSGLPPALICPVFLNTHCITTTCAVAVAVSQTCRPPFCLRTSHTYCSTLNLYLYLPQHPTSLQTQLICKCDFYMEASSG